MQLRSGIARLGPVPDDTEARIDAEKELVRVLETARANCVNAVESEYVDAQILTARLERWSRFGGRDPLRPGDDASTLMKDARELLQRSAIAANRSLAAGAVALLHFHEGKLPQGFEVLDAALAADPDAESLRRQHADAWKQLRDALWKGGYRRPAFAFPSDVMAIDLGRAALEEEAAQALRHLRHLRRRPLVDTQSPGMIFRRVRSTGRRASTT